METLRLSRERTEQAFETWSPGSKARFSPPIQVACFLLVFLAFTNLHNIVYQALLLGSLYTPHLIYFLPFIWQVFTEHLLHAGAGVSAGENTSKNSLHPDSKQGKQGKN